MLNTHYNQLQDRITSDLQQTSVDRNRLTPRSAAVILLSMLTTATAGTMAALFWGPNVPHARHLFQAEVQWRRTEEGKYHPTNDIVLTFRPVNGAQGNTRQVNIEWAGFDWETRQRSYEVETFYQKVAAEIARELQTYGIE